VPLVTYTRGNDLSASLQGAGGIGGLLARTDNALLAIGDSRASAFYHSDGNGNVTCMVNTNGAIVAKYQYDPYGNLLSLSGPLAEANTYRFSSKEWHLNSGLYYYGFRFYSPSLQRWPNSDPLGDIGSLALMTAAARPTVEGERFVEKVLRSKEESDSLNDTPSLSDWSQVNLNLFGGIGNDPVNMTDPFGLDANSYADCIERYRNPLTEQLPNAIAENLGSGRRVPGWVPPGVHGANAAGNLLAGPVRGGVPSVSGPGHPTTWQHKLLGAKYTGWSMIALTVFEGFWDLGILAGCGIAEAMEIPDPLYRGGAYEGPGRRW
jgi:RHS repeat-associated protein